MKWIYVGILLLVALPLAAGCTAQSASAPAQTVTAPAAVAPTPAAPAPSAAQAPKNFTLVSCWYKGSAIQYYDFGTNTPLVNGIPPVAPIWVFIYGNKADGTPDFVTGGHNIIDVIPGDPGYSDLWQVVLVTVPRSYQPDSITNAADVMKGNFPMKTTDMLVNCPVVPAGSTIQDNRALIQGWYKGQKVYYYDFGANADIAAPIWALITGMDAQGNPIFVKGQNNIVDVKPGDQGYSAFWQVMLVTVPAGYVPNTLKSAKDVMSSGYKITPTTINVNCPFSS
ncbi:MAG: hypothetical protein WB588_06230 [Dehalococcoidia bacterium]